KIRRGFNALRNLAAQGTRQASIVALVEEILSQRVGRYRTVLEERHDELSDPAADEHVVRLAERLWAARERGDTVWVARCGGAEIPVKAILAGVGLRAQLGGSSVAAGGRGVAASDTPVLGLALGAFKAAQLLSSRGFENAFRDFTAVDLETTGNDIHRAEI